MWAWYINSFRLYELSLNSSILNPKIQFNYLLDCFRCKLVTSAWFINKSVIFQPIIFSGFQRHLEWYWRTRQNFLQVSAWAVQATRSLPPGPASDYATLVVGLPNPDYSMLSDEGPQSSKLPCRRSKMSTSSTSIPELFFQCHFLSSTQCIGCSMWYEGPVPELPLAIQSPNSQCGSLSQICFIPNV